MTESASAIIRSVECVDLATWSDDRRKEFSDTFQARVRASRFILQQTAYSALHMASERKFLPGRMINKVKLPHVDHDASNYNTYGGRTCSELQEIAQERATLLLKELPPLQQAMQIIQPEVAAKIDRRDSLKQQAQKLADQLTDLSEEKRLTDIDPKMTVGDLVVHLKEQSQQRARLMLKIDELAKEGYELDRQVDKALADGIPGISEAVLESVQSVIDQCNAMEQISRRVHEKVMFGDSKEAMAILASFEKDETVVGVSANEKLRAAVAKLGIAIRTRKAPKKGGRK